MNGTTYTTKNGSEYTFYRANNDYNGNPRYVVHFLNFVSPEMEEEAKKQAEKNWDYIGNLFDLVRKKTKGTGLSKYRGKDFGGGFVFQSYNLQHSAEYFESIGLTSKK